MANINVQDALLKVAQACKNYTDSNIFSGDYNDLENKPTIPSMDGLATEEYVMQYVEESQLAKNNGSVALLTIPKADMDTMLEDGESELIFSKITYDENRTYYIEYDGKVYNSTSVSKNYIEFNYYDDDGFYVELDSSYSNSSVMCFYYFKYYLGYVDPEDYEEEPPMPTTATDMVIKYDDIKYLDNNLLDENLQVKNSLSVGVRAGEIGSGSVVVGSNNQASHSNSFAQGEGSVASGLNSFSSGSYTTASATESHAEGRSTTASKTAAHAEGNETTASNSYAHAEGNGTTASGSSSHAEGSSSTAKGTASHAEGVATNANGYASHSEGSNTNANGDYAHTEGYYVTANGNKSHAEGSNTRANGEVSHAEGYQTIASGQYQHVQGKFNIEDAADTYAHIVGNGTANNARSNAHTLDWDGNAWYKGNITVGADNKELATKEYVDEAIAACGFSGDYNDLTNVPVKKAEHVYASITSEDEFTDVINAEAYQQRYSSIPNFNIDESVQYFADIGTLSYNDDTGNWDKETFTTYSLEHMTITTEDGIERKALYGKGRYTYEEIFVIESADYIVESYKYNSNDTNMTAIRISMIAANSIKLYSLDVKTLDPDLLPDTVATKEYVDALADIALVKSEQTLTTAEKDQVRSNLGYIGRAAVAGEQVTVEGKTYTVEQDAEIFGDYANNIAIGAWSIAEGSENIAVGRATHVEGAMNKGLGTGCHVEGVQCTATGYWSHAEGEMTTVTSYASHAEGSYTNLPDGTKRYGTASGYASHIEGGGCHASGSCSHAEGLATTVSGNHSHVEGKWTVAASSSQHVEGTANIEDTEGKYIHIAGNGSWNSGEAVATRSNAYTLDWDGNGWFAGNVTIGADKKELATKDYIDNVAGNNIDTDNLVVANSISMGRREDTTVGAGSVAIGSDNEASGLYSHAEGYWSTASGEASHAEGEYNTASERCSHAEGNTTEASGEASHAEGFEATASGDYSHAEGEATTASGISSHAEGGSTTASEYCSHAEGGSTTASGYYSHAEGCRTEASEYYSHAEGYVTTASGEGSHAEGYLTIASSEYQHVQGKCNIEDSANTYAHIVGNGTSSSARSNAHTLDWDGNAWYKGNVTVDGTPTADNDLVTKKYVDDKFAGLQIAQITQAEYDALETKDPNTLYLIVG